MMNNHCSEAMGNRIKEQSDFETTVCDKPVKSLKRIKQNVHVPTRLKCECEGPLETVECFAVDTKQEENKDLTTHTERFKQANDTFTLLVGDK